MPRLTAYLILRSDSKQKDDMHEALSTKQNKSTVRDFWQEFKYFVLPDEQILKKAFDSNSNNQVIETCQALPIS